MRDSRAQHPLSDSIVADKTKTLNRVRRNRHQMPIPRRYAVAETKRNANYPITYEISTENVSCTNATFREVEIRKKKRIRKKKQLYPVENGARFDSRGTTEREKKKINRNLKSRGRFNNTKGLCYLEIRYLDNFIDLEEPLI
jgi:hypothetical protein